jgi:hypothetical protein
MLTRPNPTTANQEAGQDNNSYFTAAPQVSLPKGGGAIKLISVTQIGYKRNSEAGYIQKSLPPLELTYSEPEIDETVRDVDPESLENLPEGLDGANYQWVDLDGEGLTGILAEQGNGWFYKRNVSPINLVQSHGRAQIEARFAPLELVASQPTVALAGGAQFLDLAGDGQPDLVTLRSFTPGFYERTHEQGWKQFIPFKSLPGLDWDNPNLKFIDLNGDGHSDILITESARLSWQAIPGLPSCRFLCMWWKQSRFSINGDRPVLLPPTATTTDTLMA